MAHTLLVADDSAAIQRVIELTFADEDVQVVAVSNGDEAIALLKWTPPDIVLADVGMPTPSGYDIARYMKDAPELAHIPVILLTGAFEPVDQVKTAAVGCDGVLAKPFEPQLVIGRVKELLARPKSPPPSAASAFRLPSSEPSTLRAPAADVPASAKHPLPDVPPLADDLSDYFDRLDEAFASTPLPAAPGASAPPDLDGDWLELDAPASELPEAADSWSSLSGLDFPDLPLTDPLPPTDVDVDMAGEPRAATSPAPAVPPSESREEVLPIRATDPPSDAGRPAADAVRPFPIEPYPSPELAEPPVLRALPSLADAFEALLAAERSVPAALTWPSGAAEASLHDDLVEQVTRSVLERLSETVVRDTVRDTVTNVAERLMKEEIDRIKSNIK